MEQASSASVSQVEDAANGQAVVDAETTISSNATVTATSTATVRIAGAAPKRKPQFDEQASGIDKKKMRSKKSKKKSKNKEKKPRPNQCHFIVPPPKSRRCNLMHGQGVLYCGIHLAAGTAADSGTNADTTTTTTPVSVSESGGVLHSDAQMPCPYCGDLLRKNKLQKHVRRCNAVRLAAAKAQTQTGATSSTTGAATSTTSTTNKAPSVGAGGSGTPSVSESGASTENQIPEEVLALCRDRAAAKTRFDWAEADRLREQVCFEIDTRHTSSHWQ